MQGSDLRWLQVTAKHNFTHDVKFEKQQEHVLITQGIYRWGLSMLTSSVLRLQTPHVTSIYASIRCNAQLGIIMAACAAGIAGILATLAGSFG